MMMSTERTPRRPLTPRCLWLAALAFALAQLAPACPGQVARILIGELAEAEMESCAFQVSVELQGDLDPASLQASLNFESLAFDGSPDGNPPTGPPYTVTIDAAAAPLIYAAEGENLLIVRATRLSDGVVMRAARSFAFRGRARAHEITDQADLLSGPLAHGRVGDTMLENCIARFVIQDVGLRDMYSVGAFGGNLIDAELRARPGRESFLELQPMLNVETVVNAQTLAIENDGHDGNPAVVRTSGPDDLLDFVNPSTSAGSVVGFPELADDTDLEIEAATRYSLAAGDRHLKIVTTVFNNDPSQDLPLFVGDWLNAGGELEQWAKPSAGLGQGLFDELDVLAFIGTGDAAGVDYAYLGEPLPELPDQATNYFSDSGLTVVLHNLSIVDVILGGVDPFPFVVASGGSKSFTRYFAVGDGSASNAVDFASEIRGLGVGRVAGCVTLAGAPAPDARVSVGSVDATSGEIDSLISSFNMDPFGCFEGTLVPGSYGASAARPGTPYVGNAASPPVHAFAVGVDATTTLPTFDLPATGRLEVSIVDGVGNPIPGRATVVGFDPSPEPITPGTSIFPGFSSGALGLFFDPSDRLPHGITAAGYADASGQVAFDLEPGSYALFVSRGSEYSLFQLPIQIQAGEITAVPAAIVRVIETPGFVSSDFHVHGVRSHDSRVSDRNRVLQFAGEGVENCVMTDHHAHTDLQPAIDAMGMSQFLHATIGEEITTTDYGHYNAYPMTIDPTRPSGGSTDWGQAAPPGMDFPSYGAFAATPAEIEALGDSGPQSTPETLVQINHIGSHFGPMQIDTSLIPPRSLLSHAEALAFRLPGDPMNPSGLGSDLFHHFPALELWNGSGVGSQDEFIKARLGIWFNHLNQGLLTTGVFDTDTHTFADLRTAGARTWTASPVDAPSQIESADVAASVRAGRAVGGQGVFVQTRLHARDGSGASADLSWDGSTLVSSANGHVDLEIDIQAPAWAPYLFIAIYANAATTGVDEEGTPSRFRYGATPTRVLIGGTHFTIDPVVVDAGVPGATRLETNVVVPFEGLSEDTWFVVTVRGFAGASEAMFPVFPAGLGQATNTSLADLLDGNVGENGVLALGVTNPLYADVDGQPGFQAPNQAPGP